MSSYVNTFLKTEITCIPRLFRKFLGDYYNGALSNGACWLFVGWCLLHCIYNQLFRALFRRMGCRGYINKRLRQSLWYLGFYSGALMYCGASLIRSEFIDNNYRVVFSSERTDNSSSDFMIGFIFLLTFYMHSALWENFITENFLLGLNYMLLVFTTTAALYIRCLDTVFGLSVVISAAHVSIELARIVQMVSSYDSKANMVFNKAFFVLCLAFVILMYAVALPLSILLPVGLKILENPTVPIAVFIVLCLLWLAVEVITSPIYRLAEHWVFHVEPEKTDPQCPTCFVECSLFLPRDDVAFNLNVYREEMKQHREKMMSMRKPKNKNMLMQTLKCMVAIRKKINQKRLSESSDSDESEKSESESKDEPVIKEQESDSEEENEKQEHGDNEDGVLIEEIADDDAGKGEEEIVDGKLEIRVREKEEGTTWDKHPQ